MNLNEIIKEIEELEHFKSLKCFNCLSEIRYYVLQIYVVCPTCKKQLKVRGSSAIGTEIEDLMDTVLVWIGTEKTFEEALKRREEIIKDSD
jgi:uncharacterized protein YjaG (DUF416 family)